MLEPCIWLAVGRPHHAFHLRDPVSVGVQVPLEKGPATVMDVWREAHLGVRLWAHGEEITYVPE